MGPSAVRRGAVGLGLFAVVTASTSAARADEKNGEESARGLLGAYAEVEAAITSVSLNTLAVDQAQQNVNMLHSSGKGPTLGLGAGLRFFTLTLGPRGRITALDNAELYTLGGELGMSVPIHIVEIGVTMGGGMASLAHVQNPDPAKGIAPAAGYYGRVGLGLRVQAMHLLAFGGGLSYELMALTPSGVGGGDLRTIAAEIVNGRPPQAWSDARKMAGAGYGTALTISATVGLRF